MSLAESFGRSAFSRFMNAPAGRLSRVVAGLALIAWGAMHLATNWGLAMLLLGLLPLAPGARYSADRWPAGDSGVSRSAPRC